MRVGGDCAAGPADAAHAALQVQHVWRTAVETGHGRLPGGSRALQAAARLRCLRAGVQAVVAFACLFVLSRRNR